MAYPHPHRNRPQGECIELHKLGADDSTPLSFSVADVTGGLTMDVNLPYNSWIVGVNAWATNHPAAMTVKVYQFIDHQQSVLSRAMSFAPVGSATVVTVLTIAATATGTNGVSGRVLQSGGALALFDPEPTPIHGLRFVFTTTSSTGTFDAEVLAVPRV